MSIASGSTGGVSAWSTHNQPIVSHIGLCCAYPPRYCYIIIIISSNTVQFSIAINWQLSSHSCLKMARAVLETSYFCGGRQEHGSEEGNLKYDTAASHSTVLGSVLDPRVHNGTFKCFCTVWCSSVYFRNQDEPIIPRCFVFFQCYHALFWVFCIVGPVLLDCWGNSLRLMSPPLFPHLAICILHWGVDICIHHYPPLSHQDPMCSFLYSSLNFLPIDQNSERHHKTNIYICPDKGLKLT